MFITLEFVFTITAINDKSILIYFTNFKSSSYISSYLCPRLYKLEIISICIPNVRISSDFKQ